MSFPNLASITTGDCAASTTRTLTLPASIASGNQLLAISSVGQSMAHTWPAGWVEMVDTGGVSFAYRQADGTEGGSINVTTAAAARASVFLVAKFTGGTFQIPEQAGATFSNTAAADCPNLTPSFGALDTLWIALAAHNNRGSTIGASWPTNYASNQTEVISTIETLGGGIQFATYNLNAASENPAAYPILGVAGRACTIAIALSGGGGGGTGRSFSGIFGG